jgi:NADH-quinone oxidoreductase subunit C
MYGVRFDGNPDLRRLLMPANYPDFPLRKDYPLHGRGERDAYPQFRRGESAAATGNSAGEAAGG